ncbi:MAG: hypothetical protein ACREIT_04220, partial [Tepidisphaeraceae bacterium]
VHAEVAASSKKLEAWDIVEVRRALSQSYFEPVEISIPIALLASDLARENGLKPAAGNDLPRRNPPFAQALVGACCPTT